MATKKPMTDDEIREQTALFLTEAATATAEGRDEEADVWQNLAGQSRHLLRIRTRPTE